MSRLYFKKFVTQMSYFRPSRKPTNPRGIARYPVQNSQQRQGKSPQYAFGSGRTRSITEAYRRRCRSRRPALHPRIISQDDALSLYYRDGRLIRRLFVHRRDCHAINHHSRHRTSGLYAQTPDALPNREPCPVQWTAVSQRHRELRPR
jgi:hypothetical protein